jgi:hypothetical protein
MDRAAQLRHQIAEYRRQLAEGVTGDRAVEYLRQIKRLEHELAKIEGKKHK